MSVGRQLKWWAWKGEWGREQGTKEAEITAVKILNQNGSQTEKIQCGDMLTLKSEFIVHQEIKEPHFGVAVLREDGIYCHGPNTLFDGYMIKGLKEGKGWFSIEYKSLNLGCGIYRFSVAIWDKKEILAYDYHPGFYRFEIIGSKGYGELLCLPYRWRPYDSNSPPRLTNFIKDFRLDLLEGKWGKRENKDNIEINEVRFLDGNATLRDSFRTDEQMEITIKIKTNRQSQEENLYLWVGVFRKDAVYCYGAFREIANDKEVSLIYPKVQLLPGEYSVSIGICEPSKAIPLACHHGGYPFTVVFDKGDHGTVYLEHKWSWELPQ